MNGSSLAPIRQLPLLLVLMTSPAMAIQAPGVDWTRSDWFPIHPVNGPQTQDQSSDEWWYAHATSYASGGAVDGYICAGYAGFVNYQTTEASQGGCYQAGPFGAPNCSDFETTGNMRGDHFASMALIAPDGSSQLWNQTYVGGEFHQVIQTSDGGYLATGGTSSTRTSTGAPLYYNPNQSPGQVTDQFDAGIACTLGDNVGHIVLVKTDRAGSVEWQYIYGLPEYRDGNGIPDPSAAYQIESGAWDVVETPSGNFRLVGDALDPSLTFFCNSMTQPVRRTVMIEVDANGYWVFGQAYGPTTESSSGRGIAHYGSGSGLRFVVSGVEMFPTTNLNGYTNCNLWQRAYVMQFAGTSLVPMWTTNTLDYNAAASQNNFDVAISANDEILLPIVVNCTGCLYAGFNQGEGKVYRLNGAGQVIDACSFGTVTAYDLQASVTPTSDNGFAFVSSKQVNPPPTPWGCYYGTSYWNTDTYVGKCNGCGNIEWETTFDVDNLPPSPYPADLKKQECVYSISEAADGGFVISGNNSYNFDDGYVAKLLPATSPTSDLLVRDTFSDMGLEPNPDAGPMWVSDDIWVRNYQDGGLTHENPEYSSTQPNYVYVRVTNNGCQPADGELKVYWAKASTGLNWPAQWVNYKPTGSVVFWGDQIPTPSPILITALPPNGSIIIPVRWYVPDPNDFLAFGADKAHFCLLARIETATAPPYGFTFAEGTSINDNVRANNNEAWKNVTIVDNLFKNGPPQKAYVVVRNPDESPGVFRLDFSVLDFTGLVTNRYLELGTADLGLGALFSKWLEGGSVGSGVVPLGGDVVRITEPQAWIGNLDLGADEMHTIYANFEVQEDPTTPNESRFHLECTAYRTDVQPNVLTGGERFSLILDRPSDAPDVNVESEGITQLYPNSPNPFSPRTVLRFSLARAGYAELAIHDVTGRVVRTLVEGRLDAGLHEVVWDATDDTGRSAPAGIFWSQLTFDDYKSSQRMIVLR